MRIFILFLLMLVFSSVSYAQEKPPIVVELFTSEFCPACPPADRYLEKLSEKGNVVALGCHVTYFSRKSNLGQEFCSQRQFDYMQRLRERSPYTPQFVLNGRRSVVGTNTSNVAASLLKASSDKIGLITISSKQKGVYAYELPEAKYGAYEIMMAIYQKPQTYRGATYANAVDKLTKLGLWDGGEDVRVLYPDLKSKHKGFAIFVQDRRSGEIVAAGQHKLP